MLALPPTALSAPIIEGGRDGGALSVAVVGGGLAGSVTALALGAAGYRVTLIGPAPGREPGGIPSASTAAAGVFNPLTGRGPQMTWQAPLLWGHLRALYPYAESLTGWRFYHPMPLWRPLADGQESTRWARAVGTLPRGWAHPHAEPLRALGAGPGLVAPAGVARTLAAGYVDVPALLGAVRAWLSSPAAAAAGHGYVDATLPLPEAIMPLAWQERSRGGGTSFRIALLGWALEVDRVILCPGVMGRGGGWFDTPWLAPLKGEGLWLRPPAGPPLGGRPVILNRASLLVPQLGEGGAGPRYWAGSTYEHHYDTHDPTEAACASILTRIAAYLPDVSRWQVEGHQAGLRPATRHRRPVLLEHDKHPGLWLLTGLGTKGVSLAPWVAAVLVRTLSGQPHPVAEGPLVDTLMNPPTP